MTTLFEVFRSCWFVAIIGMILFLGGTGLLFWNEGRAMRMIMSLDEAFDSAIDSKHTTYYDFDYNGRIVHIVGPIIVDKPLTEPECGIQVFAVKLKRRVQMYQWKQVEETVEHNYGERVSSMQTESRTYYYYREWRNKLVDSRQFYTQFGHRNPNRFPIESATQVADPVFIRKYELSQQIKYKFNNYIKITVDKRSQNSSFKLHSEFFYYSNDVLNLKIGVVRLLFTAAGMKDEVYTLVGKLENNKVFPYKTTLGVDVFTSTLSQQAQP